MCRIIALITATVTMEIMTANMSGAPVEEKTPGSTLHGIIQKSTNPSREDRKRSHRIIQNPKIPAENIGCTF